MLSNVSLSGPVSTPDGAFPRQETTEPRAAARGQDPQFTRQSSNPKRRYLRPVATRHLSKGAVLNPISFRRAWLKAWALSAYTQ